jgi:hypothetical protein
VRMTTRHFIVASILIAALVVGAGIVWPTGSPKIVDLSFATEGATTNADELTLQSMRRVGNFYAVSYHGDYEERLRWFDREHLKLAGFKTPPSCSLFFVHTSAGEPLLGRNLDRRDTPVLAKFAPPGKHASFSFSPSVEVHLQDVLVAHPTEAQKNSFLFCLPFYPTDGINEKGLAIAIAGAPIRHCKPSESRPPMFVLLFIRRVLDNCQNLEEVARLPKR